MATMIEPRTVTVIIPAYNAARTLERAIDSVLSQDYPLHQVIIVDDCSRDGTPGIAAAYASKGVTLIRLEQNRGAAGARNVGVAAATGEFIAFQDADDEWLPGKLRAQIEVLARDPSMTLVSCAAEEVLPNGVPNGNLYKGRPFTVGAEAWKTLLRYNFIATPSVLTRRALLIQVGGFDPALRIAEDQDMWIRLAGLGNIGYVNKVLLRVHLQVDGLSYSYYGGSYINQIRYTLPMIRKHLERSQFRLSPQQRSAIYGERVSRLGRVTMTQGAYLGGMRLIWEAIVAGYRPAMNLLYIVEGAPPIRWLKRQIHRLGF